MGRSEQTGKHYPVLVQVESNIEEFPIFQLGKAPKSGMIAWERTIESINGTSLYQRLEVSSGKYKLPGRFDYDVYLAVLELLERRGGMPESGVLEFSVGELVSILGLERGGRTDKEVKESLKRIALTGIESESAFWSNDARRPDHLSNYLRRVWCLDRAERFGWMEVDLNLQLLRGLQQSRLFALHIDTGEGRNTLLCQSSFRQGAAEQVEYLVCIGTPATTDAGDE